MPLTGICIGAAPYLAGLKQYMALLLRESFSIKMNVRPTINVMKRFTSKRYARARAKHLRWGLIDGLIKSNNGLRLVDGSYPNKHT